jgi:hypothetical protein
VLLGKADPFDVNWISGDGHPVGIGNQSQFSENSLWDGWLDQTRGLSVGKTQERK